MRLATNPSKLANNYFTSVSEAAEVVSKKPNELKVLQLNVRGINETKKFNQLRALISSFTFAFDVIVFCETKLKSSFPLQIYSLPGFQMFSCSRTGRGGGGIIAYIRSSLPAEAVPAPTTSFERLQFRINLGSTQLQLLAYYRAPDANNVSEFLDELENDLSSCNLKTLIVGDVNMSSPNLSIREVPTDLASKQYHALLTSYGFKVTNNLQTRPASGKTIDHVVINFHDALNTRNDTIEIDPTITDHNAIISTIRYDFNIPRHSLTISRSKLDFASLADNFPDIQNSIVTSTDPNIIADSLTSALQTAISRSSTTRTFTVKHEERVCEWATVKTLELMIEKDKWLRKRRAKPNSKKCKEMLSQVSVKLDDSIKFDYSESVGKKVSTHDPKKMWRGLNEVLGRKNANPTVIVNNPATGKAAHQPAEVTSVFSNFFADCVQHLQPTSFTQAHQQFVEMEPHNSMCLIPPDINEILTSIKSLKSNSAAGHDGIGPKVVKSLAHLLAPLLSHLIGVIFTSGVYPKTFKLAIITPVYKSGSRKVVDNYRPISVLPILNKVVEGTIFTRLSHFFETHLGTMYSYQFGFRKKSSTENAVMELSNLLLQTVDQKKCATGIFMDLRKAFDVVNHDVLLEVLFKYGVRGKAHELIEDYLRERYQVVQIGGVRSDETLITSGVVQGSRLGPQLFLVFINAIGALPLNGRLFLFADDALLINIHDSKNAEAIVNTMRKDMSLIMEFFHQRQMILNSAKTNFMVFATPTMRLQIPSTIEISSDLSIARVASVKYLGFIVSENMSSSEHIESLEKKLAPANGILWKLRDVLPFKSKKLVYDTLFQTHLNFMSSIWGLAPCSALATTQVLQNRALRNVYNLPSRSNRVDMYLHKVENHLPVRGICLMNIATYMYKAIHSKTVSNLAFIRTSDLYSHNLRNQSSLRPVRKRTTYGARAIEIVGPEIFNRVPESIKNLRTPHSFRWALRCHLRKEEFIKTCFDSSFFDFKI